MFLRSFAGASGIMRSRNSNGTVYKSALDSGIKNLKMAENKPQEKWYFRNSTLVTAFLIVGPLALPLVWFNPRFSKSNKIIITFIVAVLTYYLASATISSVQTIRDYYRQIQQMGF